MDMTSGGSGYKELVLTRKEVFLIISEHLSDKFASLIEFMVEKISKDTGRTVVVPEDSKQTFSILFNQMRTRWQRAHRKSCVFFKNNGEWLSKQVCFAAPTEGKTFIEVTEQIDIGKQYPVCNFKLTDQETSETDAEETILPESPSSQLSLKFNEPSSISQAPKRIRISDFNEEMESLQKETVNNNNNRPDDQYDTFARHISAQLRELPVRSFVILQGQIQDLITRERLAQLVPEQEIQQYDNRPSTSHSHCSDLSIQVKEEILNKTDDENDEI